VLAALGAPEHDPGSEIVAEVDEAMHVTSRDKDRIACPNALRSKLLSDGPDTTVPEPDATI
jgi:hypothetical protein